MNTKRLALVTSHFPPSNLAGVHRARLWSQYLPEFGWDPTIITTHPAHYNERLDPALLNLVPQDLKVVRTPAFRGFGLVGDVGVLALPWHYAALSKLAKTGSIDFVLITIPSNYTALLGRLLKRRYGLPYGIDYQDPWVSGNPAVKAVGSKAWVSQQLARILEPWALRDAILVTGVASAYYNSALERNPLVAKRAVTASMPIGGSPLDFEAVRTLKLAPFLFDPSDGNFHIVYAGALLPNGVDVLTNFLKAVVQLKLHSALGSAVRVHFIGTGSAPNEPKGYRVLPLARKLGIDQNVTEHPHRMGYVETLTHLVHSSAVAVLGSTEAHYTPSKLFLAVLSARPVLAVLHEQSTAVEMLNASGAGRALTFADGTLPDPEKIALELLNVMAMQRSGSSMEMSSFEAFSARNSARLLASALDQAYQRNRYPS